MSDPKEKSRQTIQTLVERFQANMDEYRAGSYNETQVRRDFIDPFFEALGWDVANKQGLSESQREVIHEDAVKVEEKRKAPDYGFRVEGERQFFVEAKKPAVNIGQRHDPAFQVRRYAWSANLPLSILTDFEQFAVYDGRIPPKRQDTPTVARLKYWEFKDYLEKWDELYALFSREAVLNGSLERFVGEKGSSRGQQTVDAAFLQDIEKWRDDLAKEIAFRNDHLTQRELNFAVQITIDRLIFLRICEDRGIEPYETLLTASKVKNHVYQELLRLFNQADARYNSGLFHFKQERGRDDYPDTLTPHLDISDDTLQTIIQRLYFPHSPYEFSVMPAEILGQVYEQFLGKVIHLNEKHQAKVEEKPEVKKAGGVYYTPAYIVDYIVKQTVGKLLAGKTPKEAEKLRILDPACGSGSFLIGAYQYLLDWHIQWYSANQPEKHKKALYRTDKGDWKLSLDERKRILLHNIYGVDIDAQAVEVSKLSLLLKVLEGETAATVTGQLQLFKERALPDLGKNIQCGNSLIGSDFYELTQRDFLATSEDERHRVNAFDWEQAFPSIINHTGGGGFDAVIGNPPYVRQETLGQDFKQYAEKRFKTYAGTADLYVYFIEKGVNLLREGGYYSIIVANKWMRANYGAALRQFIAQKVQIQEIIDFGELPVFQNAATFPAIVSLQKHKPEKQHFIYAPVKHLKFKSLPEEIDRIAYELDNRAISGDNWSLTRLEETSILEKMRFVGVPLGKYISSKIYFGIKTGLNAAFVIDEQLYKVILDREPQSIQFIKKFALGDDVRKYTVNYKKRFLIVIPNGWTTSQIGSSGNAWQWFSTKHPILANHLSQFENQAQRRGDKGQYWWELRPCDYYKEFEKPKIVYPDIAKESRIAYDTSGLYLTNTVYFFPSDDLYLLGLLNSKLMFSYYKRVASVLGDADKGGRLRWFTQDVEKLPIRTIDFEKPAEVAQHERMVKLVESMLGLHQALAAAHTEHDRQPIQRQLAATDAHIDKLVYDLYGLTAEEIALVEGQG